jgi:hypothetical protein
MMARCVSVSLSRIWSRRASWRENSSGVVEIRGSRWMANFSVYDLPSTASLTW